MRKSLLWAVSLALLLMAAVPAPGEAGSLSDYPIPNGHFYTQASDLGVGVKGYSISDEDGLPFWSEFQRLGGVQKLGYPISRRFVWDGFVTQATQRAVLQWHPGERKIYFVNVFDLIHAAGKDQWLLSFRDTPVQMDDDEADAEKPWESIARSRLALLEADPAIKETFFGNPDPMLYFGVPTAPIGDLGSAFVLRTQRAVLQHWKVDVPWAKAGQVTVANGGEIAKEAGLIPATALAPEDPPALVTAAVEPTRPMDAKLKDAILRVAANARPAVVKVNAVHVASGTGFLVRPDGYVLTTNHVVGEATRVRVILGDGRSFDARIAGSDSWTDLAVLKIDAKDLPTLSFGGSDALKQGDQVVAIGYSSYLPNAPSIGTGVVRKRGGSDGGPLRGFVQSDVALYPGFSGGPLLNMSGQVVAVNTAVLAGQLGLPAPGTSLSIASDAMPATVDELIASGQVRRPWLGLSPYPITPELAARFDPKLQRSGMIAAYVEPASPAAQAGIQEGDVITAIDGRAIDDMVAVLQLVARHEPGDVITVTFLRKGEERTVKAILGPYR